MKQIIKKYCALLIALAMVLPVMSVRAFAAAQPSTKVGPVVEKTSLTMAMAHTRLNSN